MNWTATMEGELAPMSVREAIECAKIFTPHVKELRESWSSVDLILRIYQLLSQDHPIQVLRAMSLMQHRTVEEIASEYHVRGAEAMLADFAHCLSVNPLPDLMQAAFLFGMSDDRWSDG